MGCYRLCPNWITCKLCLEPKIGYLVGQLLYKVRVDGSTHCSLTSVHGSVSSGTGGGTRISGQIRSRHSVRTSRNRAAIANTYTGRSWKANTALAEAERRGWSYSVRVWRHSTRMHRLSGVELNGQLGW